MSKLDKKLPFKTKLHGTMRKAGLKITPSRLAILAVIEKTKKPLSAQDIIDRVGKRFDQATIYRFVRRLKDNGIIRQIDLRHNHAHYEMFDAGDHHHLMCVHCGRIEDIMGCDIESTYKRILDAAKSFVEVHQHSLEFFGVCRRCEK